jgi:hypothetical protein
MYIYIICIVYTHVYTHLYSYEKIYIYLYVNFNTYIRTYIFMNMYIRMYLSNAFIAISTLNYDTGSTILQSLKLTKTIAFLTVMLKITVF